MKPDFGMKSQEVVVSSEVALRTALQLSSHQPQDPLDKVKFGSMDTETKEEFAEILHEFADIFFRDEHDIGGSDLIKHRILLTDDLPIHRHPFRTPLRLRPKMEEILNRMKSTGAIRESTSSYASPAFLVSKDHGLEKRLVADYRELNAKTVPDRTPMPHPEDVFMMLSGMKIFAKLDITSMFNQIEIDERNIAKTAITTPLGSFECPLMHFGLMNAPATAVRPMRGTSITRSATCILTTSSSSHQAQTNSGNVAFWCWNVFACTTSNSNRPNAHSESTQCTF